MRGLLAFLVGLSGLLVSNVVFAVTPDQKDCISEKSPRRIEACTAVLRSHTTKYNYSVAYGHRARALALIGQQDLAIADYTKAIELAPKNSGDYLMRGISYFELGDLDNALADYNRTILLFPKLAIAFNNRCNVWQKKQEFTKAIADCSRSIELDPTKAIAYGNRGNAYRFSGDLNKALLDQSRAIEINPRAPLQHVNRADTLRYLGKIDDAIKGYQTALDILPNYIPAFTGLGLTYEKVGDLANARAFFEKAIASQSSSRFSDISKEMLETAQARLAALNSGSSQPVIQPAPAVAISKTSVPTPTVAPVLATTTAATRQGRRVALVIGNSSYSNVPVLANPQKDAAAIATVLRNIGFEMVTLTNDATREKLIDALRTFANEAENADWAMLYYAGHGMEVGGINYLVPIDAKLAVDRDIEFEAVPLTQVLRATDAARKIKLIMLDACRDNPFTPRKTAVPEQIASASTAGATISSRSTNGRGLAEVKVQGATLVVYAAKDGQVALDGEGGNSPFAVAVVQRLATPGVEINKLFRLVRDDVMEATAGRQEPYTYGSLPGKEDFFFVAK